MTGFAVVDTGAHSLELSGNVSISLPVLQDIINGKEFS